MPFRSPQSSFVDHNSMNPKSQPVLKDVSIRDEPEVAEIYQLNILKVSLETF